jgi:23S rRNA (guanosine2251-2'-O)-methyltransferase
MVAILEEVRSLWNVGSMFRSADGAGFSHLFLIGITGCPPRREIAKTSLGAEDYVAWNYAGSSLSVISSLKALGYQIVALEKTTGSFPLKSAQQDDSLRTPLCLVVGSEVKGIYAETLVASDLILDLPMRGFKESLNVAVAFGIASYAISERIDPA